MAHLDYINLKALSMEELAGVITLYPWYGQARKELCLRMSRMGSDTWDKAQFADAAMYIVNRQGVADIFRSGQVEDLSDKGLEELLKQFIQEPSAPGPEEYHRTVHVVGGDYFSQSQYDNVRRVEDNVFSRLSAKDSKEGTKDKTKIPVVDDDFCTEPMAQIYADQGYLEQARHIYSKLLLKFPEKSAYFASLIEKLG